MNLGIMTDVEAVRDCVNNVEENAKYYTEMSDTLVNVYSKELDVLMNRIKADTVDVDPSDDIIERYILELSNALYFMGAKLENIGVKDDVSKLSNKESYNNSYLKNLNSNTKKPTVAELTSLAENDSKYMSVLNSIYSRVYKQLKFKIDASYEMLNSLKKILSKRMQDAQLAYTRQDNGLVVGKEEF